MSRERGPFLPADEMTHMVAREEDRTIRLKHALVSGILSRFIDVDPRAQVVRLSLIHI